MGLVAVIQVGFNPLPPGAQRPEKDSTLKRSDKES